MDLRAFQKKAAGFLPAAVLLSLVFIAYARSLGCGFVWDDDFLIKDNAYIRSWSSLPEVFAHDVGYGAGIEYGYYRPFHAVTNMLDYKVWALNPFGYHLTNVTLHALAALTVLFMMVLLFGDTALAFITAAIFAVHPVNSESVIYISARAWILSSLLIMICFCLYLRSASSRRNLALIALTYSLSLLSGEVGIVFPVLLLAYHLISGREINGAKFLLVSALLVLYISARSAVVGVASLGNIFSADTFLKAPGFFSAVAAYIRLLIAPFGLHTDYGNRFFGIYEPSVWAGIAISALCAVAALRSRKSHAPITFAAAWFLIFLIPASGIRPLFAYMAERYLYLSSVGFALALAYGLRQLYRMGAKRTARFAAAALVLSYASLAAAQSARWKDGETVYADMLKHNPSSYTAMGNLGSVYIGQGRYYEAMALYKKALGVNPGFLDAYNGLAVIYIKNGLYGEAYELLKTAVMMAPRHYCAYYNLGVIAARMGMYDEAARLYEKTLSLNPNYLAAQESLAGTYIRMGKHKEAIDLYEKMIKSNPGYAKAYAGYLDK